VKPEDERPPTEPSDDEVAYFAAHAAGDRIADRYQLLRVLDKGGMGVVWVAHHLGLDVQVALKLIRPMAGSRAAASRLVREAQAAARIDHPAVLRVLDVGTTPHGDPFLVMELLDGEPLCDALAREQRLDPITAVRTLLPIVDGLSALHDKGIIHRDVKPENIFLSQGDAGRWQPKLIDFGVAKLVDLGGRDKITRRGMVVGTPVYMALEQIQGAEADAQSDVWALSAVLYETIQGVLPFEGPTLASHLALLFANEPAPVCDDEALASIVAKGLARVAHRWPSARAMGEALAGWLWSRGVTTDITGVSLRARWLDEDDIRRIASAPVTSETATARFPAPERLVSPTSSAPPIAKEVDHSRSILADTATASLLEGASRAVPARRRAVWVAALVLVVGAVAAAIVARPGAEPVEPSAASSATASAPPPPTASAPPSPMATAPLAASSSSEPVAPPPAASASSPPARPYRPSRAPALPHGLKDPFH
jgi:eukaryotic-like serine/threonine-protein kinase